MLKKILTTLVMLYATVAMAAVDVNKASAADLDGIKGIGPGTSQTILTERKKSDFKNWDDLIARVKGMGEARAAKLSAEGLTVGGAAYKGTGAAKKQGGTAEKAAGKDAKADAVKPAAVAKN